MLNPSVDITKDFFILSDRALDFVYAKPFSEADKFSEANNNDAFLTMTLKTSNND